LSARITIPPAMRVPKRFGDRSKDAWRFTDRGPHEH
jgi:hypothetical protein